MKLNTKIRIIQLVERILKFKHPVIVETKRDINIIYYARHIPIENQMNVDTIKEELATDIGKLLIRNNAIEFSERPFNPFSDPQGIMGKVITAKLEFLMTLKKEKLNESTTV